MAAMTAMTASKVALAAVVTCCTVGCVVAQGAPAPRAAPRPLTVISEPPSDTALRFDGIYQTGSEAYRPMGEHWKSKGGSWGGDFAPPHQDGNHFSLSWEGVK